MSIITAAILFFGGVISYAFGQRVFHHYRWYESYQEILVHSVIIIAFVSTTSAARIKELNLPAEEERNRLFLVEAWKLTAFNHALNRTPKAVLKLLKIKNWEDAVRFLEKNDSHNGGKNVFDGK